MAGESQAMKELGEVMEDLETLLKNPEVGAELTARGVNVSLALVAADALVAYIEGDRARAAEDFDTVAEEIATRLAAAGTSDGQSADEKKDGP
jgi:hypothetical protein